MTQLWIRACKSQDPMKRLGSIVRRYYGIGSKIEKEVVEDLILYNLAEVCEYFLPIKPSAIIKDFNSLGSFRFPDMTDNGKFLKVHLDHIRQHKVKGLAGLRTPSRFRNKYGF